MQNRANSMAASSLKLRTSMAQLKHRFASLTDNLEHEYKTNLSTYRNKYYELVDALNGLYTDIKLCHHSIVAKKVGQCDGDEEFQCQLKTRLYDIDPMLLIQFCKAFCNSVVDYFKDFEEKEKEIKMEMGKMFSIQANSHFLQALAKKNLENYDLGLKLQQLQKMLQFKTTQCKLAEKATLQYQKKFKACEKDFNNIVVSIANILKQSEISETELRQENRFQKELLQAQKIEFQRYKADFKMKPSYEEKADRIRQVLDKKYRDREILIIKQTEKIVEQKLRNHVR